MWRALAASWIIALGYWLLRATVLSAPEYCPDKIWESGPPECDYTPLDVAFFVSLPILLVLTAVATIWFVARRLRRPKQQAL
jgi:lysylphosphatidylglycerol synthetase-like protein (DUF2156 family)